MNKNTSLLPFRNTSKTGTPCYAKDYGRADTEKASKKPSHKYVHVLDRAVVDSNCGERK